MERRRFWKSELDLTRERVRGEGGGWDAVSNQVKAAFTILRRTANGL
jgi:hypothetical protein